MPANQNVGAEWTAVSSIPPATINSTQTGSAINLGTVQNLALVCYVDVGAKTDGTHVVKLQDSADNSTWADVAASNLSGSFPANVTSNTPVIVSYIGGKQYVRAVSTVTPGATGAIYGVQLIGLRPRVI